jgi:hypothetical protein
MAGEANNQHTFLYLGVFLGLVAITALIVHTFFRKWKCVGNTCDKVLGGDFDSLESCQQTCSGNKLNKYDCVTATDGKKSCVQNISGGGVYNDSKTCEASCTTGFMDKKVVINNLTPPYQRPVDTRLINHQTGYNPLLQPTNFIPHQTGYRPLVPTNFIPHQTGYRPLVPTNFIPPYIPGYNPTPIDTNLIHHYIPGYNPTPTPINTNLIHHYIPGYNPTPTPINTNLIHQYIPGKNEKPTDTNLIKQGNKPNVGSIKQVIKNSTVK